MGPVLCATRGGEACRRTQEKAIDIAQERGVELIFLYAVDLSTIGPVDEALEEPLRGEMARLGRSLLRMAQARARKRGMNASTQLLFGSVSASVKEYVRDKPASTLVLGTPRIGTARQVFTTEGIQSFAQGISDDGDVDVVVVT